MAAHVYERSGFLKALGFLFLSLIFFDLMSVQVRVLVQTRPAVELSACACEVFSASASITSAAKLNRLAVLLNTDITRLPLSCLLGNPL